MKLNCYNIQIQEDWFAFFFFIQASCGYFFYKFSGEMAKLCSY